MQRFDTVAIVGVGLIGASIGLGLRRRNLAREVVGIGRRKSSLRVARQRGAISSSTVHLDRGVAEADLIIICTPVESIVNLAQEAAEYCPEGALITDVGSTKVQIVEQLNGHLPDDVHFLGSHPLAGSEQSGAQAAQVDLLKDRTVIITPTRRTQQKDRRTVKRLWSTLGARVVEMTPLQHDRAVATVSHLPHLVAAALAGATSTSDLELVAGGWLDTTRIAAGDAQLWTEIVSTNRQHILQSLKRFETSIAELRDAIESGNDRKIKKLLSDGKRKRDAVQSRVA